MNAAKPTFLVADVGGTNTRVGLTDGARLRTDTVQKYPNAAHDDLEHVLSRFLRDNARSTVDATCVAVAGPVRGDAGELTNLAWSFSTTSLAKATGAARVEILNDLQAQGHGLDGLDQGRLRQVYPGKPAAPHAARLVVGVGTGFNIAPVFATDSGKIVPASESGHGPLPVRTALELELSHYLTEKFGYPEIEEALSGRGLACLYEFFAVRAGLDARKDAAQIMASMTQGDDPIAVSSVQQFIHSLAIAIGHLALVQLPFGGIYLIGGVARAVAPYFERFDFVDIMHEKGRFSELMHAFPIHVVEDDYAALAGCAGHLAEVRARTA